MWSEIGLIGVPENGNGLAYDPGRNLLFGVTPGTPNDELITLAYLVEDLGSNRVDQANSSASKK